MKKAVQRPLRHLPPASPAAYPTESVVAASAPARPLDRAPVTAALQAAFLQASPSPAAASATHDADRMPGDGAGLAQAVAQRFRAPTEASRDVVQCGRMKTTARKNTGPKRKVKRPDIFGSNPYSDLADVSRSFSQQTQLYLDYKKRIAAGLDDDADVQRLNEYHAAFNELRISFKKHKRKVRSLPIRPQKLRPVRAATKKYVGSGVDETDYADYWVNVARGDVHRLWEMLKDLKTEYPTHSGGFGAKGRAHAMDTTIDKGTDLKHPHDDDSFLSGITLDGTDLDTQHTVAKAQVLVTSESAGPSYVMGTRQNTGAGVPLGLLARAENGMDALGGANWDAELRGAPVGADRGAGQYSAMNQTNATGYAWMAGVPHYSTQRWEWLHIRGAGLGGATDGTNLVAGVRDANTHMIPFESNIRRLGTIAGENPNYEKLEVHWSVGNVVNGAPHLVDAIQIDWKLHKDAGAGPILEPTGRAVFNPLNTATNISKDEVTLLEDTLKQKRDNLPS